MPRTRLIGCLAVLAVLLPTGCDSSAAPVADDERTRIATASRPAIAASKRFVARITPDGPERVAVELTSAPPELVTLLRIDDLPAAGLAVCFDPDDRLWIRTGDLTRCWAAGEDGTWGPFETLPAVPGLLDRAGS